jgi:uronate dehydrogenase
VSSKRRVLITGAAGLIGGILRQGLATDYDLTALDEEEVSSAPAHRASMTRLEEVQPLFRRHDVVIDLAARSGDQVTWDDVYRNNIPATRNALEAARRASVRRVIFASSNFVTAGYERQEPYASVMAGRYDGLDPEEIPRIGAGHPLRPNSPYAVGKAFGEAIGRLYAETFGMSVLCLRIGTVNEANRPLKPHHFAKLLTHRDLLHLVDRCVQAPEDVRFAVFYGVSANTWRVWDLSDAERAIGYQPKDNAEQWREPGGVAQ